MNHSIHCDYVTTNVQQQHASQHQRTCSAQMTSETSKLLFLSPCATLTFHYLRSDYSHVVISAEPALTDRDTSLQDPFANAELTWPENTALSVTYKIGGLKVMPAEAEVRVDTCASGSGSWLVRNQNWELARAQAEVRVDTCDIMACRSGALKTWKIELQNS